MVSGFTPRAMAQPAFQHRNPGDPIQNPCDFKTIDEWWGTLKARPGNAYEAVDPSVWATYDEQSELDLAPLRTFLTPATKKLNRYLFAHPGLAEGPNQIIPGRPHYPGAASLKWRCFFEILQTYVGEAGAEAITPVEFFSRPTPPPRITAASAMLLLLTTERYARAWSDRPPKGDITRVLVTVHPLKGGDWWAGLMTLMDLADHQWGKGGQTFNGYRGLLVPEFKKELPAMWARLQAHDPPLTEKMAEAFEGAGKKGVKAQPPSPPVKQAQRALLARVLFEQAQASWKAGKKPQAAAQLCRAQALAAGTIADIKTARFR